MSDICEEITRAMQDLAGADNGSLGLIVELLRDCRTEIERLRIRPAEAAAFLDGLADRIERWRRWSSGEDDITRYISAAADCRKMAEKLRK